MAEPIITGFREKKPKRYNKHLVPEERTMIEKMIISIKNVTYAKIAAALEKDPTTIKKEIANRRIPRTNVNDYPTDCKNFAKCPYGRKCKEDCPSYEAFSCKKRDKCPFCCNGCEKYRSCRYQKFYYYSVDACINYNTILHESRQGFNITKEEIKEIGEKIAPMIKDGNSVYAALSANPEITLSEKSIYTYIENGLFKEDFNLTTLDLRRVVSRKLPKQKKNLYKKREDKSYLKGRNYLDYTVYMADHPNAHVLQMDTVYNDVTNGPFIQTFKFVNLAIIIGIYHTKKDSESMLNGIKLLRGILGDKLYKKYCEVILTDRGSEFVKAEECENIIEGWKGHIFYCDPMCSHQKGTLENNHIELRYILPKEKDLRELGLTGQEPLNLVFSHINSFGKEKLNGKSPLDYVKFYDIELYEKLISFGIQHIDKKDVKLKPSILLKFKKKI